MIFVLTEKINVEYIATKQRKYTTKGLPGIPDRPHNSRLKNIICNATILILIYDCHTHAPHHDDARTHAIHHDDDTQYRNPESHHSNKP